MDEDLEYPAVKLIDARFKCTREDLIQYCKENNIEYEENEFKTWIQIKKCKEIQPPENSL